MSYLVLARKWRPRGFEDLAGQEPIMQILKNAVMQGRTAHAYLFSGPRGVGKTSSARIMAKALNCKDGPTPSPCGLCESCVSITNGSSVDVIEIDGASNNSVDDVRDLRERVKYAPAAGRYKVYIIDEVHMLSTSAFNALLKTLEEPPAHVVFVLATTEMKKIPATVLSRCQHMPFRRISTSVIKGRLALISESEGIRIAPGALNLIARAADGSMRDSLTILDQIVSFSEDITEDTVKDLLGVTDFGLLAGLCDALVRGDRVGVLDTINILSEQGADMRSFVKELVQFFRDILILHVMSDPRQAVDWSDEEIEAARPIVSASSEDQIALMLSELIKADSDVRQSSYPRLALEIALIKVSFLGALKPLKDVIEHMNRYGSGQVRRVPTATEVSPVIAPVENSVVDETAGTTENVTEDAGQADEGQPVAGDAVESETVVDQALKESVSDISSVWDNTVSAIEPPLSSFLSNATVRLSGEELLLTLDAGQALFEDSVRKNLDLIGDLVSKGMGRKVTIRLGAVKEKKTAKKRDLREKVMSEPVIKEVLDLFDGRVVDVRPSEK